MTASVIALLLPVPVAIASTFSAALSVVAGSGGQVSGPPDRLRAAHLTSHCGWRRGIRRRVVLLVNGDTSTIR